MSDEDDEGLGDCPNCGALVHYYDQRRVDEDGSWVTCSVCDHEWLAEPSTKPDDES